MTNCGSENLDIPAKALKDLTKNGSHDKQLEEFSMISVEFVVVFFPKICIFCNEVENIEWAGINITF